MPGDVQAAKRDCLLPPFIRADKAFRLLAKHGHFDNLAAAAAAEQLVTAAARTSAAASSADARVFPSSAGTAAQAAAMPGGAAGAAGLLMETPGGPALPVLVGSAVVVPLAARLCVAVREALATLGIGCVEAAGLRGLRFAARFDPAPGCAGAFTGTGCLWMVELRRAGPRNLAPPSPLCRAHRPLRRAVGGLGALHWRPATPLPRLLLAWCGRPPVRRHCRRSLPRSRQLRPRIRGLGVGPLRAPARDRRSGWQQHARLLLRCALRH